MHTLLVVSMLVVGADDPIVFDWGDDDQVPIVQMPAREKIPAARAARPREDPAVAARNFAIRQQRMAAAQDRAQRRRARIGSKKSAGYYGARRSRNVPYIVNQRNQWLRTMGFPR